ncbi:nuclear transport factor 2 family protein [Sphingomonas sp. MMS12-HWE2-04]|uniref:nuclear transport factor 2 family protein n=1 Tax=Sphingomonas sp. MMS12-HWE2-04 TaxID=3234199 RepID=UPI00384EFEA7
MHRRSPTTLDLRALLGAVALSVLPMQPALAQQPPAPPTDTIKTAASHSPTEQQVIDLSKTKWDWMADKKVDSLATLFDDRAMFTHMGGTWGKVQELATIKSGGIWYKKASIHAVDVRVFGDTAIVLEDMDLEAVVGARTVTNAFMVTEVYTKQAGTWRLAQLTFSHLLRPVKAGVGSN